MTEKGRTSGFPKTHLPTVHHQTGTRRGLLQPVIFIMILCILFSSLCIPVTAARDVKVALTELKPSLFTDDQRKPSGFFVDLINGVGETEGWNIIWVSGTISESWNRLVSGEIDLMPAVTVTPDRLITYDFSNESALSIWSQVYTQPSAEINTILDLDGKRVAMVRGASSGAGFKDYAFKFGINATYIEKDTPGEVFAAVANGEADALVVYNSAGQEDSEKFGLADTPVMFNPAQFGFATLKGKNKDLLEALDKSIAEGKKNPSSAYSQAMQRWYGIQAGEIIPSWIWWGFGGIACFAVLFVTMSYILKREVRRKTAELATQNRELQEEVSKRILAEAELVRNHEELSAAYEQLSAMDKDLKTHLQELQKSENALMQARKKLNLLNTLTIRDIKNTFFILSGYIQFSKEAGSLEEAQVCFTKEERILETVQGTLAFVEKYQNLGINQPKWQNVVLTLITAMSHLDYSKISRTVDMPEIEIFADPLLEDVFLALMETIILQGPTVTSVNLHSQEKDDGLSVLIESDGPGIPDSEKTELFTWEHMGKRGISLFLAREILSITGIALNETGEEGKGIRFEIMVPKDEYRMIDSGKKTDRT